MCRLAEQLGFRDAQLVGELGEAHDLDLIEHRDALGAVAIGPFNVVVLAACGLDEIFEESLVVGRKVGHGQELAGHHARGQGGRRGVGGAPSPRARFLSATGSPPLRPESPTFSLAPAA